MTVVLAFACAASAVDAQPAPASPRVGFVFVDRILRGSSPAQMPVEQPTKLALMINLQAARRIGLDLPRGLVARADRVIE